MVIKKIVLRKGSNTVTGLMISLVLIMGIFIGSYFFIVSNVTSANLTLDSKYGATYGNITEAQGKLDNTTREIREDFGKVKEAGISEFVVNGLRGLGNVLLLPIQLANSAFTTWTALIFSIDFIPGWAVTLSFIGIIGYIVFLIVKMAKGEPNM